MPPSLLAAVALALAPPAEPAPLPTAAELADSLAKVRAAVRDVHVVCFDRNVTYAAPDAPPVVASRRWLELVLKGDAAQVFMDQVSSTPDGQPTGTPSGTPLTAAAAAFPGQYLLLLRPPGVGDEAGRPVRAMLSPTFKDPARGMFSDRLYTTHDDVEGLGLAVPHLAAGRSWSADVGSLGLTDQLVDVDPAAWTVDGREVKDGRPAVRVMVVTNGPIEFSSETYGGVLEVTRYLRAWFTDDGHHDLFRVEDLRRLRYEGREASSVDTVGEQLIGRTVMATDFRPLSGAGDGVRVPFAGRFVFRTAVPSAAGEESSTWNVADAFFEEFLRTNAYADPDLTFVQSVQEWQVETLEPLDPAVTEADLWIKPPDGAYWHDVPTGRERLVGLTDVESWLIFTFRSRNAAWWAFGPPLVLCGVIAAVWWRRRRLQRWMAD